MVYAGFWRRLLAHFVDSAIIGLIIGTPLMFGGVAVGFSAGQDAANKKQAEQHSSAVIILPTANDYTTTYPENVSSPAPTTATPEPTPPAVDASQPEMVPYDGEGHQSVVETPDDNPDQKDALMLGLTTAFYAILFLVGTIYHTAFVGSKMQSTPGKRLLGCMVVKADGSRLSYLHAFGRHLACAASMLTLYIGFFLIGWTKQKTGLHDLIAGTRVVRIKPAAIVAATPEEL